MTHDFTAANATGRTTSRVVVAMLAGRDEAERAVRALHDAGFARDSIGVAMRDRSAEGEVIQETGSRAAEGAAVGAMSGGVLGGLVGLLVGVGALAIPGIGPVIAGGVLASALGVAGGSAAAGAGIGAATGGVFGSLVGLGVPDDDARHFERRFHDGGVLVTVDAGDQAAAAVAVLNAHGADLAGAAGASPAASAAPRADYTATTGAITGSAFDTVTLAGAAEPTLGEPATWAGVERRQSAPRGRRRTDHH